MQSTDVRASRATIAAAFLETARRQPSAVALRDARRSYTYGDLADQGEAIAAALVAAGISRGAVAGVVVHRDAPTVAALLGTMLAGAAYVPLDPALPPARHRFILEDSGASALLGVPEETAPLANGRPCVNPQRVAVAPAPAVEIDAHDLAYIIYTSGSTGTPKGVEVEHASVLNLARTLIAEPGYGPNDRVLALTTPAFDMSVVELLVPLIAGAQIELVEDALLRDLSLLVERIDASDANVLQSQPALWRTLVALGLARRPGRRFQTGGEALTPDLTAALLERCDELWNMYGPTETTVYATIGRITDATGPITIGRPVDESRVLVLREDGSEAPLGETGELVVTGACVARGYRNREELTAQRFGTAPDGTRMYRTGDLGYAREDGTFICLGRIDDQVKVRGYRVELGEIEATLRTHQLVRDCVVAVREPTPGDTRLVAYVVPAAPGEIARPLRTFLATVLPEYEVPSNYVTIDAIPVTPNGKVDRKSLPSPFKR